MGNCITKHHHHHHHYHCHHNQQQNQQLEKVKKKSPAEIAPADQISADRKTSSPGAEVTLCGDPDNPATHVLRFSLLYKPLSLRYFPSQMPLSLFTLRFSVETLEDPPVSGDLETVLDYIDSKLPNPPLLMREKAYGAEETSAAFLVVRMAEFQHRSMTWHLERLARWVADLATRGGKAVDPSVGTPRMEVSKFGKSYGRLLEVLLEHAQMEERVIFPILHAADRGVCQGVNEEHARDLPIMNGIKEDIKSIGVLKDDTSTRREALYNLSTRLEALQENCKRHFVEEEKNLFPLLEAADLTKEQQRKVVEQCVEVMLGTHSHLFRFFIEGLLPHEAVEYLRLLMNCLNKEKATSVLRVLAD